MYNLRVWDWFIHVTFFSCVMWKCEKWQNFWRPPTARTSKRSKLCSEMWLQVCWKCAQYNIDLHYFGEMYTLKRIQLFCVPEHFTQSVVPGLTESQDINMYLKPLANHFQDFEQIDFDRSEKLLAPMMHTICLVWANCEHYRHPARVIVLLQEICNLIMECVSRAWHKFAPLQVKKTESRSLLQ